MVGPLPNLSNKYKVYGIRYISSPKLPSIICFKSSLSESFESLLKISIISSSNINYYYPICYNLNTKLPSRQQNPQDWSSICLLGDFELFFHYIVVGPWSNPVDYEVNQGEENTSNNHAFYIKTNIIKHQLVFLYISW